MAIEAGTRTTTTLGNAFRAVGSNILSFLRDVGGTSLMLGAVIAHLRELPRTWR